MKKPLTIILALVSFPSALHAQTPVPSEQPAAQPTLEQVLTSVLNNFADYLSTVPNLFADEHLVSSSSGNSGMVIASAGITASGNSYSTTESIFRLKRDGSKNNMPLLVESCQIQSVDHRPPAPNQKLTGPVFFYGGFSYAASFISPALENCYDYSLKHSQRLHGATVLVLDYASKKFVSGGARCPVPEQHSGRVFLDPASLQIVRIEQFRPRHDLNHEMNGELRQTIEGQSGSISVTGVTVPQQSNDQKREAAGNWSWSIDYAPVTLNRKSFWLPKTITSKTMTNDVPLVHWSFVPDYSNYHLMGVSSTILPGFTTVPEQ